MEKTICVFIVRHGEREDEVINRRQYSKWGPDKRLDPSLTPQGFAQAQAAFDRLGAAIHDNFERVAVFSSPLRRALGTATMISASYCATSVIDSGTRTPDAVVRAKFVLPTPCEHKQNNSVLPIVIWDGLCDCAAQVARLGGNKNAIRTGFLHCAASLNVYDANQTTKLQNVLSEMEQLADEGIGNISESPVPLWKSGNTTTLETCPFQLWKVDDTEHLVPMMGPTQFFKNDKLQTRQVESQNEVLVVSYHGHECPIDQVVRMAINAGCDACIVVSHREEIREMYKYRCGYQAGRKNLPYCCIGRFDVEILGEEGTHTNETPLRWTLHDVTPFEELTMDSIRTMVPASEALGTLVAVNELGSDELLCHVSLVLGQNLPFADLESCSFVDLREETKASTGVVVRLKIREGHEKWYDFLYRQQNYQFDVIVGAATLKHNDGSTREAQVSIHREQQPDLPCPPKFIVASVHN